MGDGVDEGDDVPALVDVNGAELTGEAPPLPPSPSSPRINSAAADTPAPAIAATNNAATSTPRVERRGGCSAVEEGVGGDGDGEGAGEGEGEGAKSRRGTSRWVGV